MVSKKTSAITKVASKAAVNPVVNDGSDFWNSNSINITSPFHQRTSRLCSTFLPEDQIKAYWSNISWHFLKYFHKIDSSKVFATNIVQSDSILLMNAVISKFFGSTARELVRRCSKILDHTRFNITDHITSNLEGW